jgi:HMG (high mobility group) box
MVWEEKALQDKARFQVEKAQYSGPWRVPRKNRMNPDVRTPKRPMSAFLAFSHANRAEQKKKNPSLTNNEITRILAQQWKDAPDDQKKVYIDQEYALRQKYLEKIASWRHSQKNELLAQRQIREELALKKVAEREKDVISHEVDYRNLNYDKSGHYFYSMGENQPWSPHYYQDSRQAQITNYGSRNAYEAETPSNAGEEYDSNSNFQYLHKPAHAEYYSPLQHFDPHFHYQSHYSHLQRSRFQEGISNYFQPEGISSDYHAGSRRRGK